MNDKPGNRDKDIRRYEHDSPDRRYRRSEFLRRSVCRVAIRPEETEGIESLNDAECLLFTYVPDVKKVHEYTDFWANAPPPTIWRV